MVLLSKLASKPASRKDERRCVLVADVCICSPSSLLSLWLLLGIFVQKVFEKISMDKRGKIIKKNQGTFITPIFKVDITTMPLFFLMFYSLVPKIEICMYQTILNKISKSSHSGLSSPCRSSALLEALSLLDGFPRP